MDALQTEIRIRDFMRRIGLDPKSRIRVEKLMSILGSYHEECKELTNEFLLELTKS